MTSDIYVRHVMRLWRVVSAKSHAVLCNVILTWAMGKLSPQARFRVAVSLTASLVRN